MFRGANSAADAEKARLLEGLSADTDGLASAGRSAAGLEMGLCRNRDPAGHNRDEEVQIDLDGKLTRVSGCPKSDNGMDRTLSVSIPRS